jgi:acyl-coenzyme A synthetase/AMP-(fatty) acid ligase
VAIGDDGQLLVKDRLKELLKVDGDQVPPAELELVLREHPAVRDAAVVGRPDPEVGEVPVAYVVLAAHKRLQAVRIVDQLPRLPTGKLQRRALRDRERRTA